MSSHSNSATAREKTARGAAAVLPSVAGIRAIALCVVSTFAFLLALDAGRRGFQPLDHSIVFDAAHRLLSGQRAAVDFTIPVGLVPALLQAAFFAVWGTSWWAFCLHAALANAVAAVLVFVGLAARSRDLVVPLLMGVATSVVLLPPVGVPFPDPWSMLFSIAGLVLADRSRGRTLAESAAADLGIGALVGLAFLSKPIPALFVLPAIGLVLVRDPARIRRWLAEVSLLGLGFAGVGLILGAALGAAPGLLWRQFIVAAAEVGRGRLERLLDPTTGPAVLASALSAWALPVLLVSVAAVAACWRNRSRSRWLDVGAALALILASLLYALLSLRHALGSLGWFPLALGLALTAGGCGGNLGDEAPKRTAAHLWWWIPTRASRGVVRALILLAAVAHLAYFQVEVNLTRVVNLVAFHPVHDGAWSPRGLEYLDIVTPEFSAVSARGLSGVLEFLGRHPGSFYLFGDASVLYGLSGRPSIGRALWFHPWVTIPWRDDRATISFQEELIEDLVEGRVRYVVLEGSRTHLGVTPDLLPRVRDWVARRGRLVAAAGEYRVIEIGPPRAVEPEPDSRRHRSNRRRAVRRSEKRP